MARNLPDINRDLNIIDLDIQKAITIFKNIRHLQYRGDEPRNGRSITTTKYFPEDGDPEEELSQDENYIRLETQKR